MKSLYALRIVKPPTWTIDPQPDDKDEVAFFRPGLYCAGPVLAFRGTKLVLAAFYDVGLDAATALTGAETRHPGMEVEIVEFREQVETSRAANLEGILDEDPDEVASDWRKET